MKVQKRRCLILCFLILLPIGAIAAFYIRFELFSHRLESELQFSGEQANAAKHAYAASEMYKTLRLAGCGQTSAEELVMGFGKANEYAERVLKFHKPDSATEIVKDMKNNLSGAVISEWATVHEKNAKQVIIQLAEEKALAILPADLPENTTSIHNAMEVFEAHRTAHRQFTLRTLDLHP